MRAFGVVAGRKSQPRRVTPSDAVTLQSEWASAGCTSTGLCRGNAMRSPPIGPGTLPVMRIAATPRTTAPSRDASTMRRRRMVGGSAVARRGSIAVTANIHATTAVVA
jgi:hypothetical protein